MSVIDHGEELYRAPPAYIDRIIRKYKKLLKGVYLLQNHSEHLLKR